MSTSALNFVGKLPDSSKLIQFIAITWHLEFGNGFQFNWLHLKVENKYCKLTRLNNSIIPPHQKWRSWEHNTSSPCGLHGKSIYHRTCDRRPRAQHVRGSVGKIKPWRKGIAIANSLLGPLWKPRETSQETLQFSWVETQFCHGNSIGSK